MNDLSGELVEHAQMVGVNALAITDRDGVQGIVRAHVDSKEHGVRNVVGSEVTVDDGSTLVLLAPCPRNALHDALERFPNRSALVWCQEEPANMGAWTFVRHRLSFTGYAGRKPSASPATGLSLVHKSEQQALVAAASRVAR